MVTLKDIARACGVSTATVSYVVNGGPRQVLPATRDRVLKAVAELGYYPNAAARSLMGKRTHTFGVVFPNVSSSPLDNQYFAPVLAGIIEAASERKRIAMLFTGMTWMDAERNVPLFCDGRCDGFLFVAPPPKSDLIDTLIRRNAQMVLIGTRALGAKVSVVDVDNVAGSRAVTQYLLDLGHRKIGMFHSMSPSTSVPERIEGFRQAMRGTCTGEEPVMFSFSRGHERLYEEGSAYDVALKFLSSKIGDSLTAVVCTHDSTAMYVIEAAQKLGKRVPEDLSVVGFDDLPLASAMTPSITTVRQPLRQLGASAASMLFDHIDGETAAVSEKLFDVQLVERGSTARPKAGS